jgi:hypothetical protein
VSVNCLERDAVEVEGWLAENGTLQVRQGSCSIKISRLLRHIPTCIDNIIKTISVHSVQCFRPALHRLNLNVRLY